MKSFLTHFKDEESKEHEFCINWKERDQFFKTNKVKEGWWSLTKKLCEPERLVVVLDGDGAGVEEDQHDHEPEPGGRLREIEQGHQEEEEDDQGVSGQEKAVMMLIMLM